MACVIRAFGLTLGIVTIPRLLEFRIEPGFEVSPSLKVNGGAALTVPPHGRVT